MAPPHVCILMATRNGAAHLRAQLDSIAALSHRDWSLWISDDQSTDATPEIAEAFRADHPHHDIRLIQGPGRGSAANFLSLTGHPDLPADAHVALSDQDDVWMPDRLERALALLGEGDPGRTRVYASRTVLTTADLRPRGLSRRIPGSPNFGNAMVQNILAGNTIVLNPAAAALMRRTAPVVLAERGVAHHDWWIYLLMSGVGAGIVCDDRPGVYYRQHRDNLLGANRGGRRAMSRLTMIWDGRYADWIDRNVAALLRLRDELTPENRALLAQFAAWRAGDGRGRSGSGLRSVGVRRQTRFGNALLRLSVAMGRL